VTEAPLATDMKKEARSVMANAFGQLVVKL
jgi:hypothetical protein